jgi:hypothetical protein
MTILRHIFQYFSQPRKNNKSQGKELELPTELNGLNRKDILLIQNCYSNPFNIDLEKIHNIHSIPSEYHTNYGKPLAIDDLNLINKQLDFKDGLSTTFTLVNFENKNFLLGNNSCYPCSIVYSNDKGYKWVEVLIIPKGDEIIINRLNSPIRYSFYTLKLFKYFHSKDELDIFADIYIKTFENNSWFSSLEVIQLVIRSSLNAGKIYDILRERKLLNPFQLAIFSVYFNCRISNEELYHSLLINNKIPLGITYLVPPKYKIKFAQSTSKLLSTDEFKNFIESIGQDEIDSFFELNYLKEAIAGFGHYTNFLEDILSIDDIRRWEDEKATMPISSWKKNRLARANITKELIQEYYRKVILNLRNIENKLRSKKGYNIVGSLYQESLLYKAISENFPDLTILSQYSPRWLGRQRFDIYIKELHIAVEYNGLQHYEPVNYFGGEDGFVETVKRDEEKRKKCAKNNCLLIEVKYNENFYEVIDKIIYLANNTFNKN